jgi:AraC-like DNA-binding protein
MKVPSHVVFAVALHLRAEGKDPQALAGRLKLAPAVVQGPEAELEGEAQERFLEAAASALGDPHVGLTVAARTLPGRSGLLEFLCASSDNMRQVIERACRYFSVLNPTGQLRLTDAPDGPELLHTVRGAPHGLGRHSNEFTVASFVEMGRQFSGEHWTPKALWFAHAGEVDEALARFFGTRQIRFGQENNGFSFSASVLELDVQGSNPALSAFLERQAAEKVPSTPGDDLASQVDEAIRAALPDGAPSIERIAVRLGLSARTLQRRLDEQGTSFAQMLEQIRHGLAERYLADAHRPLSEIAFRLGYSDLTAFLRAYKRWTGKTPGEVRQRARG